MINADVRWGLTGLLLRSSQVSWSQLSHHSVMWASLRVDSGTKAAEQVQHNTRCSLTRARSAGMNGPAAWFVWKCLKKPSCDIVGYYWKHFNQRLVEARFPNTSLPPEKKASIWWSLSPTRPGRTTSKGSRGERRVCVSKTKQRTR